ncbi:MAG: hypothetical protein II224_06585, partial [Ruminococcus sp.]|nr:hypothetical protein [Ruminococcus sp.]
GWDGTNEANLMTKQADGTYTKDYTVGKAYDAVQLKSVKNGAEWIGDETGNNVTFNLTGAGTFTVTYDPEANVTTVSGDIVAFITEFEYDTVFAVGNGEGFWLNGAAWDPSYVANEMTEVAEDVWEIEFENVPDGFERQVKFAIDGAWTHNFGGAFEDSGVETAAVYNGDNITFDTDDLCTIKLQLNLSNFDFSTKEGATFTLTINYGDEPEEPTEAPTEASTEAAPEEPVVNPTEPAVPPQTDSAEFNTAYEAQVLRLVNAERAKYGLSPFAEDSGATQVAHLRAKELVQLFDHTRPNGSSCFTAASELGVSYRSAGENIAYGYPTPEAVVNGWMNSEGHRKNILSASFGKIGIGCVESGGVLYWSQFFIN